MTTAVIKRVQDAIHEWDCIYFDNIHYPVFTPLYIMHFVKEFEKKTLFAIRWEEGSQKQILYKHGNFRFFLTTKIIAFPKFSFRDKYSLKFNFWKRTYTQTKILVRLGFVTLFLTNKPKSISLEHIQWTCSRSLWGLSPYGPREQQIKHFQKLVSRENLTLT
jgi:hypothetical protein